MTSIVRSAARSTRAADDLPGSPAAGRRRFVRRLAARPLAVASAICLVVVVLAAAFAPYLTPHQPDRIGVGRQLQPPSAQHPLGTDQSGRDALSRLLYGARISLTIGVVAMLISVVVGTALGVLAGYFGGAVDALLMRLTDAMLSIPLFFQLLVVLAALGSTVTTIVLAIGLSSWMATARIVRGNALQTVNLDYVTAARALGASDGRIVVRHVLPSAIPSMLVASTLGVGQAILIESALSYLGVGVQPPTASWGNMLSNAQSYLFTSPLLALWPGCAILLAVLSFNFIGDAARDANSPYQS